MDPNTEVSDLVPRLGEAPFAQLVAGFYDRVRADDLLAPMYPENDWEGAEERLREFLIGRCGGPQRYIEKRGHPRLRMRHAPYELTPAARDRWMELMGASLDDCLAAGQFPEAEAGVLRAFLDHTATFLINRPG